MIRSPRPTLEVSYALASSTFTTSTSMDYSKEIEELLLWLALFDWWEDYQAVKCQQNN
jgi:hypothetical protein